MEHMTRDEIRKLCRICLKIQAHMRFLSSSELINGNFWTLSQMLKSCTSIQVAIEDEYPNMVCQSCINRLYISWDFKVDCEKSEEKLHQMLKIKKRNMEESQKNVDLPTNTCQVVVMENAASINTKSDIKFMKVISVKNLKNNLKIVKRNAGDNTKKVIVENLEKVLEENNVKLHCKNNNNNVSLNNPNHVNILTNKQNRISCIENENKESEISKKIIFFENSPALLALNNQNGSPVEDVQYFENSENMNSLIENIDLAGSCEPNDSNIKEENISLNLTTLENPGTIDLTLSDAEDDHNNNEKLNGEKSNIECDNSETSANNTPVPEKKKAIYKRKNENEGSNQCTICKKILPTKIGLHFHMKTHTDTKNHCCPICDKTFGLFSNLEMHLKSHIEHNSLKCPKCSKYFSSMALLNEHKKSHDVIYFDCDLCCKKFSSQSGLTRHYKHAHSGINQYFCDVCMKGFTLKIMLKHHRKTHAEKKTYKCHVCETIFSTFDKLAEHNDTHMSVTSFKCDKCHEVFTTSAALKLHKIQNHAIEFCKICSVEIHDKSALKEHMQKHKKTRGLTCKICLNVFDSALKLKEHIKTHFTCDQCPDSFENLRLLNIHKKKHFVSPSPSKKLHANTKSH